MMASEQNRQKSYSQVLANLSRRKKAHKPISPLSNKSFFSLKSVIMSGQLALKRHIDIEEYLVHSRYTWIETDEVNTRRLRTTIRLGPITNSPRRKNQIALSLFSNGRIHLIGPCSTQQGKEIFNEVEQELRELGY